ncbi:MAG: large conductance mechanosensitive channel protein MscL [Actinomycetales bacterium]|nr:MAG: large conductance mechanosensitive channel protein MscL [Actinomycetales bacterium]
MFKGFKDFIMRGNVVELAVAVVIGSAFAAVVDAFVSNIINPLLAAMGGVEAGGLGLQLVEGGDEATFINIGAIINAFIVFLLTAAVVYFAFVLPMNKLSERRKAGQVEAPEEPSEEIVLLREIRDSLKAR